VRTRYIGDAVKGAFALNFLGLNVTVPYKSDVIPFLSDIDPLAKQIGAVNTLVRTEEGFKGYNTDVPGLYRAMCSDGVQVAGEKVLILGAGGVARAVALLMTEKDVTEIILLNRTVERAEAIAAEVNDFAGRKIARAMSMADHVLLPENEKYVVIQATSVGMHPHEDQVIIEDEAFYRKVKVGYDLVYNPAETKFMKYTKAAGAPAYNGAKMLLYQGIIAYELWNDCVVSDEQAELIYGKMLESMKR